jgi:hypothetical protein
MDPEEFIDACLDAANYEVELGLRAVAGKILIDDIRSYVRGDGRASRALRIVTDMADEHGVTLAGYVCPEDGGGLGTQALT